MEEALRLSTEQKLQQRLTPMQVQFVRMLEMSGPEVEEEVRRALDDNPALEQCDNDTSTNLTKIRRKRSTKVPRIFSVPTIAMRTIYPLIALKRAIIVPTTNIMNRWL